MALPKPTEAEFQGLSLTRMRALVRKGLGGLDSDDINDTEVDELLNLAFWDVEERFPFKEKECRVEFPLTIGENMYLVPGNATGTNLLDLEAIKSVSVVTDEGDVWPVARMTQEHWDSIAGVLRDRDDISTLEVDSYGLPSRFVRMDESIILHPVPDKVYRLRVYFLKTLKSIVSGTVEQINLPRGWNLMVVQGAIGHGHFFMQDYNLTNQAEAIQARKINSAVAISVKEETNSRYARLIPQHEAPNPGYD